MLTEHFVLLFSLENKKKKPNNVNDSLHLNAGRYPTQCFGTKYCNHCLIINDRNNESFQPACEGKNNLGHAELLRSVTAVAVHPTCHFFLRRTSCQRVTGKFPMIEIGFSVPLMDPSRDMRPKCISFHRLTQLFCLAPCIAITLRGQPLRCAVCVMHNR